MGMVEDVLAQREDAHDALATHIGLMLNNATTAEEATAILAITPMEMTIERASIRDAIKYRDWSVDLDKEVIETNFDDLVRAYHATRAAPLTDVVETAPIEDRNFMVIRGLKSLGMFSTLENAKAAQACGEAGWDIYQKLDDDTDGSSFAVVYPSEKPFVARVGETLEEVAPAVSEKTSVFRRI